MVAVALSPSPSVDRPRPLLSAVPSAGNALEIDGGVPLRGHVQLSGSKNEVLPCLAATLLTSEAVMLHNVPRLLDVGVMLNILTSLGADVTWVSSTSVRVRAGALLSHEVPALMGSRLRASVLLAGPLLARMGKAVLPLPGGDAIGKRRLDTHVQGFEALGAVATLDEGLRMVAPVLVGAEVFLDEPSVTGTENLVMAAVLARGDTVIRNAACEPHVAALCRMLVGMGAEIEGAGTGTLRIRGVSSLHGTEHTVGNDLLEAGSFAAATVMTRGDVFIHGVCAEDAAPLLRVLRKLGALAELEGETLHVAAPGTPRVVPDVMGGIPRVDDGPWPAFPTDLMSVMLAAATQCDGPVLFFEKMYDGRMFFTEQLGALGGRLFLCDPHRVMVCGPSPLKAGKMRCTDVRAGMAMVLAALCAEGTSTVTEIHHVDRGYDSLEEKLRGLGARIRRVTR